LDSFCASGIHLVQSSALCRKEVCDLPAPTIRDFDVPTKFVSSNRMAAGAGSQSKQRPCAENANNREKYREIWKISPKTETGTAQIPVFY